jgi:hypothetical protein
MSSSHASLPASLVATTLDRIVSSLGLVEVTGDTGGPLLPMVGVAGPIAGRSVGALRVFTGAPVLQVVTIDLVVPAFGLDSHMLFAFGRPDDVLPHFTVDAVFAGGSFAFHLDLVPRVDPGAHLAYLDGVFAPLTETFATASATPDWRPADIGPRQRAFMSPWMLVGRTEEEGFLRLPPVVAAYLEHWLRLARDGVPAAAWVDLERTALAARDQRNKDAIFDPAVDPVWTQVARLVGEPAAAHARSLLRRGAA